MSNRIMVIAAHPDDETLGCGGTILRHVAQGDEVGWVIVTKAYEGPWSKSMITRKREETDAVGNAYGIQYVERLGFESGTLDAVPTGDLITSIGIAVVNVRPDTVYLIHPGDIHTDHERVFATAMVALKPMHTQSHTVKRILCYETVSSTDQAPPMPGRGFLPQVYHDITPHINRKLVILDMYKTESQLYPRPRERSAVRALARVRGATIGVEYAEAFQVVRWIW